MSTEAKVPKMDKQKDVTSSKNKYNYRQKKKFVLEPGITGFMVTCNFQAKNCIREAYNLLNSYADKLYGADKGKPDDDVEGDENNLSDEDIADSLLKESEEERKKNAKENVKERRFQCVNTGGHNFLFIRTASPIDPVQLGEHIVSDIAENRLKQTQYLMRLVPIEVVCHISEIVTVAGQLADKHFLKQGSSFSVAFNKRFNNVIKKDDIIRDVAELIKTKNIDNRVELTNPEKTIVVEIMKGLCLLSVVSNYNKYKKYNLSELTLGPKEFTAEKLRGKSANGSANVDKVPEAEKVKNEENGSQPEETADEPSQKEEEQ